ncbi:MAG TPA: hypothetical protein VMU59_14945 [Caulobacteraceae bacterium]|nr:hypothetical protein [Caulobacteraceae bacterium]
MVTRASLKIGLSLFLAGVVLAVAPVASAQARLIAGAGKATIEITPTLLPLQDFGLVHDPLQARVLVLGEGSNRVALVVLDMTSLFAGTIADVKDIVSRTDGVDPADIFVCASHTFSAPHIFGAGPPPGANESPADIQKAATFNAAVKAAVQQAAGAAAQDMRPARMGFGAGTADVNVNRNKQTADGWWLGADDTGATDKAVGVVRFEDMNHQPVAVLMNYAVQSAIMDGSIVKDGAKAITADLAGAAVRHVEDAYSGKAVAMFLIGAAGDQFPSLKAQRYVLDKDGHDKLVDIGADAYPLITLLGERLGAEALRVSETIKAAEDQATLRVVKGDVQLDSQDRPKSLDSLHPHKTYDFKIGAKVDAPYFIMLIGDVAIVGVQAELSSDTGAYIKRQSPFKETLVMTMVNGAAKYMPGADGYDKITYEAMNSPYGKGSAEIFSADILKTLSAMRQQAGR